MYKRQVQLLSGITAVLIDGYDKCMMIDCRTYPARGVGEPEKDKVLRGSRDGFVETLIFNTALIRRRIRDPKLIMEILSAGNSSHTDIAVCYMEGRVDEELLKNIRSRIQNLRVDALTMNQESLAAVSYTHLDVYKRQAVIALALYVGLVLIMLTAFDITLTLPGVAGIILSVGMAVDANVIIFTRIKEEIGLGRSVKSAIKAGFSKALSAILDGNITTLIAAAVLYFRGSGTVKGFASTLAIGIVLSMFTALFITKGALYALYAVGFEAPKFYGTKKDGKIINFLGKKNICFILSIAVIVAGWAGMARCV